MKKLLVPILNKEVPATVLAVALLVIGAGAAAGAASGTISGEGNTQVEQAVVIGDEGVEFSGSPDGQLAQVSDDNTSFVTGATIRQGEDYNIKVNLNNRADENVTAKVVLKGTAPLHVDADSDGSPVVQQTGQEEFLITVGSGVNNDELILEVSSEQDISPGFYEFEVTIQPVKPGDG